MSRVRLVGELALVGELSVAKFSFAELNRRSSCGRPKFIAEFRRPGLKLGGNRSSSWNESTVSEEIEEVRVRIGDTCCIVG